MIENCQNCGRNPTDILTMQTVFHPLEYLKAERSNFSQSLLVLNLNKKLWGQDYSQYKLMQNYNSKRIKSNVKERRGTSGLG